MSNRKAFTLIELLVVIAIIAILMAILMPALSRVNKQAKAIGCQSSLHQWTLIWQMYSTDNNGKFINVKPANQIPVFMDCYWYDVWPHDADVPLTNVNDVVGPGEGLEMKRVCLDRHNHTINCAFIDWSIRKVDLKELWTLKWHRNFNVNGPWTKAGGATPDKWPQWMKGFKDY